MSNLNQKAIWNIFTAHCVSFSHFLFGAWFYKTQTQQQYWQVTIFHGFPHLILFWVPVGRLEAVTNAACEICRENERVEV